MAFTVDLELRNVLGERACLVVDQLPCGCEAAYSYAIDAYAWATPCARHDEDDEMDFDVDEEGFV